jgi:hypothetical protein
MEALAIADGKPFMADRLTSLAKEGTDECRKD